jgi:hypothetical protein
MLVVVLEQAGLSLALEELDRLAHDLGRSIVVIGTLGMAGIEEDHGGAPSTGLPEIGT